MVRYSLEQLEKDYWKEPKEFPTSVVRKSYELRKKPLRDLTIEEIRHLISQSIGLEYLVPLALDKLDGDILAEGDFYPGDLLMALSNIQHAFWEINPALRLKLKEKVEQNRDFILSDMGEKEWGRIEERLQ